MTTIDVHQADIELALLVERVERGETILIAKAGKPIAKLVPMEEVSQRIVPRYGFMHGRVPEDFDRMFEDEIAEMFGAR